MHTYYSTVIDKRPIFYYQGWILINSLIKKSNISPEYIIVNAIHGVDAQWLEKIKKLGVNITMIAPYGDGKYCNKLRQLENPLLSDADCLVMMDADMIVLKDIQAIASRQYIRGKVVDAANPELPTLKEIFDKAQFKTYPPIVPSDIRIKDMTFQTNFNGGLYIIPAIYIDPMKRYWMKWATWLLANPEPLQKVGKIIHIDQVSFSMATHELDLPIETITKSYNYPAHQKSFKKTIYPHLLHFHQDFDKKGLLLKIEEYDAIYSKAIDDANEFIIQNQDDYIKSIYQKTLE